MRVAAIAWKLIGTREVVRESGAIERSQEKIGKATKRAGEESEKSGKHFEVFGSRLSKARKEAEHTHKAFGGLGKKVAGYGLGIAGAYGALDIAKGSIESFKNTVMETRRMEALGFTNPGPQSFQMLAMYKARGIGYQELGQSAKALSRAQYQGERQLHQYNAALDRFHGAQKRAAEGGKEFHGIFSSMLGTRAHDFQELGINVKKFAGMDMGDKLKLIGHALTEMDPKNPERVRLAVDLLGKSATRMLPMFTKGRLGMDSMEKMAAKFIPGFKGGAKAMEEWEYKMAALSMATDGLKLKIGMALTPVLLKLMGWFTKLYSNISHGVGAWKTIGHWITKTANDIKHVVLWFINNEKAALALAAALGALAVLWTVQKILVFYYTLKKMYAVQFAYNIAMGIYRLAAAAAIVLNIGMAASLALVTVGIIGVTAGLALIGIGVYMIITHWKQVKHFFVGVWHWMEHAAKKVAHIVMTYIGYTPEGFIIKHWKNILNFFLGLPSTVGKIFSTIGHAIWTGIKWGLNKVIGAFEWILHHIGLPGFHVGPVHFGGVHPFAHAHLPKLAAGGYIRTGGAAVVGERGPEVVHLPAGAQVDPSRGPGRFGGSKLGLTREPGGDLIISVQVDKKEIGRAVMSQMNFERARLA